jgi:hypothetical protein
LRPRVRRAWTSGSTACPSPITWQGRAHRDDRGTELERYELYRRDNVATTRLLFAAAQRNSVDRFIYLSSIKVLATSAKCR